MDRTRTWIAALVVALLWIAPMTGFAEEAAEEGGAEETAEKPLPKGYESWDPEVARWGWKGPIEGIVLGSVGFGLLVAGDQISRDVAIEQGFARGPVMSTLNHADHIPRGTFSTIPVEWGVRSYVGEYLFLCGLQFIVPSLGSMIPSAIAGATGADLHTVKTVGCFAMGAAYLPTGLTHLFRWATLYVPQWQLQLQDEQSVAYVIPGMLTMIVAFVDLAISGVGFVWGIVYATGTEDAADTPGLFPMPDEKDIPNIPPIPMITTDGQGGVLFGLHGQF